MRVHEAIEQAIAEEYVRLQGSTLQQLLEAAGIQTEALSAAVDPIAREAYDAWQAAAEQAAYHLFVTLRVSMDRTLESVLDQPDVQAVLRRPFEHAADATRDAIVRAWEEGAAQGLAAANDDLRIAGLDTTGPVELDESALNRLLDDAAANGDAARDRFLAAIQSTDSAAVRESVRRVGRDQALRARAGADVAGRYAAQDAKVAALEQASREQGVTLFKVWVTSFSPTTCRFCARLHGTRRRLDEPFPPNAAFGTGARLPVWHALGHPPRHPNCRCRIVLHQAAFEDEPGPTLASMLEMARSWWQEFIAGFREGWRGLSNVELARTYVGPHIRITRKGTRVAVDAYWRDEVPGLGRSSTRIYTVEADLDAPHPWPHGPTTQPGTRRTPAEQRRFKHRLGDMEVTMFPRLKVGLVDNLSVMTEARGKGLAEALAFEFHEENPGFTLVHHGFASSAGRKFAKYMVQHHPTWNVADWSGALGNEWDFNDEDEVEQWLKDHRPKVELARTSSAPRKASPSARTGVLRRVPGTR
jgi:hypothetical protein